MSDRRRRRDDLPVLASLRRIDLRWFDLSQGMLVAVRVLRAQLGVRATLRLLVALVRLARKDPLAHIAIDGWSLQAISLARHQLRPVLLLDEALREELGLGDVERLDVLREVVAETGALFVRTYLPVPDRASWRRAAAPERTAFVRALSGRMFNARIERVEVADDRLAFDVSACLFVTMCRAVDRASLAPLFCNADARNFAHDDSVVRLERTRTLADGGECCDFRFRYRG